MALQEPPTQKLSILLSNHSSEPHFNPDWKTLDSLVNHKFQPRPIFFLLINNWFTVDTLLVQTLAVLFQMRPPRPIQKFDSNGLI